MRARVESQPIATRAAHEFTEAAYSDRLLRPGNTNCAGCGMSIGLEWLDEALRPARPVLAIPACCGIVTAGAFPTSAYGVPAVATTFASSAAVATGLSTIMDLNHEDVPVVCWAGDGGTYDIGLATLSAAAERNENVIYICYDNEIYGNTGGQRSSATPAGVATTTTPQGKAERKKDIMSIMAAHRIPYAATLSVAHRADFLRKIRIARRMRGFRFLVMLSPCPTGWKSDPARSVDLIGEAVRCGIFPLYEVFDGIRYRINVRPEVRDVGAYVRGQKRFRGCREAAELLRNCADEHWEYLEAMTARFPVSPTDPEE